MPRTRRDRAQTGVIMVASTNLAVLPRGGNGVLVCYWKGHGIY
jgi:hypothetical protein